MGPLQDLIDTSELFENQETGLLVPHKLKYLFLEFHIPHDQDALICLRMHMTNWGWIDMTHERRAEDIRITFLPEKENILPYLFKRLNRGLKNRAQ